MDAESLLEGEKLQAWASLSRSLGARGTGQG